LSRICIFSRPFYPNVGGLERIAQILATQFADAGHAVEVVTDTPALHQADDLKFSFKIIRTHDYWMRVQTFKTAEVVLLMNISLHGILAAAVASTPIILSHHGTYDGDSLVGRLLAFCKRRLTIFYQNITVSSFVARHIPASSVVIPNAYDNLLFTSKHPCVRERDFVFCGRLISDKGADICIQAFADVLRKIPDTTLTVIGGGPELEPLQHLAQDLGVTSQIEFTGTLTGQSLVNELRNHVCLVAPSLCEDGFGIVALEGIACCETLIVSRRGGFPEAAGPCGLAVEPSACELASAMKSVALAWRNGQTLPGQPSSEVRTSYLARHTPEIIAQQYLRIIEAVISHRRRG
jgi:glycogen(starch) synthase